MPLEVAPWGDAFGQLVDKYGVSWMVNIAGPVRVRPGRSTPPSPPELG